MRGLLVGVAIAAFVGVALYGVTVPSIATAGLANGGLQGGSSGGVNTTTTDGLYLRLDGGFMNDTIKTSMTDGGVLLDATNTKIVASTVDGGTSIAVTNGSVSLVMGDGGVGLTSTGQVSINVPTQNGGTQYALLMNGDDICLDAACAIRINGGGGFANVNTDLLVFGNAYLTNGGVRNTEAALPTCNSGTLNIHRNDNTGGGTTTKRTKPCICTRDSDDTPEYQWRNTLNGSAAGTATTCPDT